MSSLQTEKQVNNGKLLDLTQYNIKKNTDNPEYWARLIFSQVTSLNEYGDRRFGFLAYVAESTRHIICYNHPALKQVCRTAFTDGEYIYMDADFLMEMVNEYVQTGTEDMIFVLLHELNHMLSNHVQNYGDFLKEYPETTNIALDMRINLDLHEDYVKTSIIKGPGQQMMKGVGYRQGIDESMRLYGDKAEILILEEMLKTTDETPKSEQQQLGPNDKAFSLDDVKEACKRSGLDKTWEKIKEDLKERSEPDASQDKNSAHEAKEEDKACAPAPGEGDNPEGSQDKGAAGQPQQKGAGGDSDAQNDQGGAGESPDPGQSGDGNNPGEQANQQNASSGASGAGQTPGDGDQASNDQGGAPDNNASGSQGQQSSGGGTPGNAQGAGADGQSSNNPDGGAGSNKVSAQDIVDSLNGKRQGRHSRRILEELGVQVKENMDPSKDGVGESLKGMQGEQGEQGEQGQGQGQGKGEGQGQGDDPHMISQEDIANILEQNGLENVKKVLDIPDSNDAKAHKDKREHRATMNEAAIKAAEEEMRKAEQAGRKMAGSGSLMTARRRLDIEKDSRLSWRTLAAEMVSGQDGMHMSRSDRSLHSMYYFEPEAMGLTGGSRLVDQGNVLVKREGVILVLVDTSGSVSKSQLREFLSELKNIIADEESEDNNTVILMDIDTRLADDFIILNDEDINDWLQNASAHEGGGTNLQNGIVEGLNAFFDNPEIRFHSKIEGRKLTGMVMFTDLCDSAPNIDAIREDVLIGREDDPMAEIPPTVFVTDRSSFVSYGQAFGAEVKTWAGVFPISDKVEIDLEEIRDIQIKNRTHRLEQAHSTGPRP